MDSCFGENLGIFLPWMGFLRLVVSHTFHACIQSSAVPIFVLFGSFLWWSSRNSFPCGKLSTMTYTHQFPLNQSPYPILRTLLMAPEQPNAPFPLNHAFTVFSALNNWKDSKQLFAMKIKCCNSVDKSGY